MSDQNSPDFSAEKIQFLFAEIAKLITSSLEVSKVITALMEQVNLFFEPTNWSLLRLDPATNELFFVVAKGLDENVVKYVRLKLGEGIAGEVAKTGRSMFVENVENNPAFSHKVDNVSGFKTRSIIAVPIKFQGQVLGVIELINALDQRAFTGRDLSILETIADFSAIALTNAMTYERMSFLAVRDPLTRLYNRARLEKLLQTCNHSFKVIEKKREADETYTVVALVDIDKFKEVNDTHGHQVGDQILLKTSELLQACCREDDFAFRIGGDEFLLVIMNLLETDVETTSTRLESQLQSYSRYIMPAQGFSFGIVSGLSINLASLIKDADKLMYAQKAGRKVKTSS